MSNYLSGEKVLDENPTAGATATDAVICDGESGASFQVVQDGTIQATLVLQETNHPQILQKPDDPNITWTDNTDVTIDALTGSAGSTVYNLGNVQSLAIRLSVTPTVNGNLTIFATTKPSA